MLFFSRLTARYFSNVVVADNGCWKWVGTSNTHGYGHFHANGRSRLAHRVGYELMVGPIPKGLELDHLCRNRCCVNPEHLEPVTGKENLRRSKLHRGAINSDKKFCNHGHPFDSINTYYRENGSRKCRACHSDAEQKRRARLKGDI